MKATIVDLRYRMKDVLRALDRNEEVRVLCHGKLKGIIKPASSATTMRVQDHPFFGMSPSGPPVAEEMERLRGGRHRDL